MNDYYYSVKEHVEIIEYIQKSKFITQVFPIDSEDGALNIINKVKKKHYKATHNVYAYILGKNKEIQKCTDDGEPSGTAGVPILEIIKKENLINTLVIVTRYFGGIKLGAGGLIRAYAHMAKIGIENSEVIKNVLCERIEIAIDYTYWGKLENNCNNYGLKMHKIDFLDKVYIYFHLQEVQKNDFYKLIKDITNGDVSIKSLGYEYISISIY
jgi:uncharacterized YigZ family protein